MKLLNRNLDHRIAWDRASILLKESWEQQRKWKEAWEMAQLPIETEGGFSLIRMYHFYQSAMNSDFNLKKKL
jgi:hypothetical protein